MKLAYADPPYLGCCARYEHYHPDGKCWDDASTHAAMLERLRDEYPDGWAVSLSTPSLEEYSHLARAVVGPNRVRWGYWLKPFASFKPGVNPAYAWEPIMWLGGRAKRSREENTVRDWCAFGITLKRGLTGAKPEGMCYWLFDLLGMEESDELVDLYPGSGAVSSALDSWRRQRRFA